MGERTPNKEAEAAPQEAPEASSESDEITEEEIRAALGEDDDEDEEGAEAVILAICIAAIRMGERFGPTALYNILKHMEYDDIWDIAQTVVEEERAEEAQADEPRADDDPEPPDEESTS